VAFLVDFATAVGSNSNCDSLHTHNDKNDPQSYNNLFCVVVKHCDLAPRVGRRGKPSKQTKTIIMPDSPDECLPQAVTDFIFDLYDSISNSQVVDEQTNFYRTVWPELSQKYFQSTPWPSPKSIASECNGDPLFLAVYRELTHRHWHNVNRPSLHDRMVGWDVYKELFDEILESSDPSFYILPVWVFEILHEFVYQFQGFCQLRTSNFNSAQKLGLVDVDGKLTSVEVSSKHSNVYENLQMFSSNKDAWDTEAVFSYLKRLIALGSKADAVVSPVSTFFTLFGSVALSRLECLLGDYTSCLQALDVANAISDRIIIKDNDKPTAGQVLASVVAAKVSLAYHAGIAYLQLRRYADAGALLADCAGSLQRGFKSGSLRQQAGSDQFNKLYDRILSLLAILQQICPGFATTEELVMRACRDKHGSKIEATTNYEEWFQAPKFIVADPVAGNIHNQQTVIFVDEMSQCAVGKTLRSYMKLYTSMSVEKLAHFHDLDVNDFIPLLLAYKLRMQQTERTTTTTTTGGSYLDGVQKSAMDIHYYLDGGGGDNNTSTIVRVDQPAIQRRFETYFAAQIAQCVDIQKQAAAIDPII
jgi:translation initiation factor 3 subunit L